MVLKVLSFPCPESRYMEINAANLMTVILPTMTVGLRGLPIRNRSSSPPQMQLAFINFTELDSTFASQE